MLIPATSVLSRPWLQSRVRSVEMSRRFNTFGMPTPKIETGSRVFQPKDGSWEAEKMLEPKKLEKWGFIVLEPDMNRQPDYTGIISLIKSSGSGMGMAVAEPMEQHFNVKIHDLKNLLLECLEKEVQFLFIILPASGRDYYQRVKKMAECEVGILTQCIKNRTARRINLRTVKNVMLKVNTKLMGINHALNIECVPPTFGRGNVMVVGMEIVHPSSNQKDVPTVVAVAATLDPKYVEYNVAMSLQAPKKQVIADFENIMLEHLQRYVHRNKALPAKILYLRVLMPLSQRHEVLSTELSAIRRAYERVSDVPKTYSYEVSVLLLQNPAPVILVKQDGFLPGTHVDCNAKQFLLVSHLATGLVRPTNCYARYNRSIPPDELKLMTYYLCYLCGRCPRSVPYPAPALYARLACKRARTLIHGENFDLASLEQSPQRLRVSDNLLRYGRMFFV